MNKHTHGPWHVETKDCAGNPYIRDAAGNNVARVYRKCTFKEGNIDPSEYQANAALLAASPDLLAAAEAMLQTKIAAEPWLEVSHEFINAVRDLSKAVNKAKGV